MAKAKNEPASEATAKNPADELLDIAKGMREVAVKIPSPGVLDSQLHSQQLKDLAARLEKLAETL